MAQNSNIKAAMEKLAQFTSKLAQETQDEFNKVHQVIEQNNEVVAAIIRVIGHEAIEAALQTMRQERRGALVARQKAGIEHLVGQGILKTAESIVAPDGFVVGTDTLADGTERRVQFELAGIEPEFLPLYVGKKPGDVIEGNGAKLTIVEVYTLDREKLATTMKEQAEAALKAQQDANAAVAKTDEGGTPPAGASAVADPDLTAKAVEPAAQ